ncbi:MAG: pitrilysin family protein [Thermoanaerobaculia bacterium]
MRKSMRTLSILKTAPAALLLTSTLGAGALATRPLAAADLPAHPDKIVFAPFTYTPPAAKDYRTVLKAGPVVYIAEDHELPLVTVSITLRNGTYLTPAGKEGLAGLAGYLLTKGGTKSRKAKDLDEDLAFLAANLNSAIGDENGSVSLNLLSKDVDKGLAILRQVLTEPAFEEEKLKLRKDQLLNDMKTRNDDSADIEARERGFLATGQDFYTNRYVTRASLDAITREDLVAFHQKWFDARNMSLAVAGDFKKAEMLKKLETLFASWPIKGELAPAVPKPSHTLKPGVYIVDKDVNQGRVSILLPGVLRSDPDYLTAQVMNDVLGGGGFTSRITNRVRSDEGLAYSAGSGLTAGIWYPGVLRASFQSKVRTCSYASQIVLEVMKGMAEKDVTDEELETAKKSFTETLPRRFATKAQTMSVLLDEEFTGRYKSDPGYYASFKTNIDKVTKADVKRVAARLLSKGVATILVVGKKNDLLDPDPKHPVKFADLGGGSIVELPLRDPYTMKPMSREAAAAAAPATSK